MTTLRNLINPPPQQGDAQLSKFNQDQFTALQALSYLKNPSVLTNSNFAALSAKGLSATTQADGNNIEFVADWNVFGASSSDYTITPTPYPHDSIIKSASPYYVNVKIGTLGSPFYFFQRQPSTVRQYQREKLVYGLLLQNNQSGTVNLRMDIYTDYDGSTNLVSGGIISLQGNQLLEATSILKIPPLSQFTVGVNNYTEFGLNFVGLTEATADINIYMIKCEPGEISTPL